MSGARTKLYAENEIKSPRRPGLFEKIFHRVFQPMNMGRLTLILPDGRQLVYGRGEPALLATIRVRRLDFFKKCALFGDVGFGEAYVDGDWETDNISKVVQWMILNVENHPTLMDDRERRKPINFLRIFNNLYNFARQNSMKGSRKNISAHYDLGNEFYKLFLDPTMTYSAAYFRDPEQSLEEAQIQKYDELCQKLKLKSTDHVLEMGTGWGGFAVHAAKNYGCRVTTVTISKEQYRFARQRFVDERLTDRIDVQLQDYRTLDGVYDKIVSIEMIEAVGHRYYETYFRQIHKLLKKDGILGLQMILSPDHRYDSFRKHTDWIQKYIFPGSLLPCLSILQRAIRQTGTLILLDYKDITSSYVKTLALWREKFNEDMDKVRSFGFDDAFIRKWNYYLSYCEAAFYMRNISVVQVVFSRPNNLQLQSDIG